jgi:hypothetical protein
MPQTKQSFSPNQAALLDEIARRLAQPLTEDPIKVFDLTLAEGQTHDRALAEWHAFEMSAIIFAIETLLRSKDSIEPVIKLFQQSLLDKLSPGCSGHLAEIGADRQIEYGRKIPEAFEYARCGNPEKLMDLSIKAAGRVIGRYDEFCVDTQHSQSVYEFSKTTASVIAGSIEVVGKLIESIQVNTSGEFV